MSLCLFLPQALHVLFLKILFSNFSFCYLLSRHETSGCVAHVFIFICFNFNGMFLFFLVLFLFYHCKVLISQLVSSLLKICLDLDDGLHGGVSINCTIHKENTTRVVYSFDIVVISSALYYVHFFLLKIQSHCFKLTCTLYKFVCFSFLFQFKPRHFKSPLISKSTCLYFSAVVV